MNQLLARSEEEERIFSEIDEGTYDMPEEVAWKSPPMFAGEEQPSWVPVEESEEEVRTLGRPSPCARDLLSGCA